MELRRSITASNGTVFKGKSFSITMPDAEMTAKERSGRTRVQGKERARRTEKHAKKLFSQHALVQTRTSNKSGPNIVRYLSTNTIQKRGRQKLKSVSRTYQHLVYDRTLR